MFKDTVVALLLSSVCCYIPNLQSRDLGRVHFTFHFMQQFISDETEQVFLCTAETGAALSVDSGLASAIDEML